MNDRAGLDWTREEKEKLKSLCQKEGLSYEDIADEFERSISAIRGQCHNLGVYPKDIQEPNWEHKREEVLKKIRKPRFKEAHHWQVENRILLGLLMVHDIKLSEFAEMVGVSPRTVQRWVYEGKNPCEENLVIASQILNIPDHILFGMVSKSKLPEKEEGKVKKKVHFEDKEIIINNPSEADLDDLGSMKEASYYCTKHEFNTTDSSLENFCSDSDQCSKIDCDHLKFRIVKEKKVLA